MGCDPDIVTYGIMVVVLCKAGMADDAIRIRNLNCDGRYVFDRVALIVVVNIMNITAINCSKYRQWMKSKTQNSNRNIALRLLFKSLIIIVREMDSNGCRPTSFIYGVLVYTYGTENRIEDAVEAFLEKERNGIKADVVVYNALIGVLCKVNKLKNVYRVLNEMDSKGVAPNARTCNIIINSLIGRGETDEAFKVFCRMIKECEPDADTYTIMIKMFCERDELNMAFKVWKYMKLKRFIPSMHTFSVLIRGLCEKGNAAKVCVPTRRDVKKGQTAPSICLHTNWN